MIDVTKGRLGAVLMVSALGLTGCVSQSKYDALQTQYSQLQQQNASLAQELDAAKAANARLQGAIKFVVNSDLLFPSGSWEMKPQGQRLIADFAKKLAPTLAQKLVVNGYTDNQPIGPDLAAKGVTSNEILSQKRAEAVMQFMISQGVKADMISAKGWGEQHPVASNKTSAGRAKNRRVEITSGG